MPFIEAAERWGTRVTDSVFSYLRGTTPSGNPLPRVIHATLPAVRTTGRRVILVGDVHACAKEFEELLEALEFEPKTDVLVSVGDLVNKGPASAEAAERVLASASATVRGNHDDSAYAAWRAWRDGRPIPSAKKHAWVVDSARVKPLLMRRLAALPFTLRLPTYRAVVCHAGLVPAVPLTAQSPYETSRMRDVSPRDRRYDAADAAARYAEAVVTAAREGRPPPPCRPPSDDPIARINWHDQARLQAKLAGTGGDEGEGTDGDAVDANGSGAVSAPETPAQSEAGDETAVAGAAPSLPGLIPLAGIEKPGPLGYPWVDVYRGPDHVFFGHDSVRALQLAPWATGIDTGCVYGGELTVAILPALDDAGEVLADQKPLPEGAREFTLGTGLTAHLFSIKSAKQYAPR